MSRIHYKNYRGITLLARKLRRNQTPSEIALWSVLRRKNLNGYKFLRQHPVFYRIDRKWIEFFVADFYCSKLKLVIELDGNIHLKHKEYDSERDAKLSSKGIQVVRLLNDEVDEPNFLIDKINKILKAREQYLSDVKQNNSPSLII